MKTTRRGFAMNGALLAAAGFTTAARAEDAVSESTTYKLVTIGRVEVKEKAAAIRLFDAYAEGLLGLDQWSHVQVLYWMDKNDTPERRKMLRVHPRGKRENPLTGVFACRSPFRPNLIALSVCRIAGVEGALLKLEGLDAFDGTPVLDLKPYIPPDAPTQGVKVPDWARGGPGGPGGHDH